MSGLTSDVFDEHLVDESSQYMLDDLQLAAELGKTLLERNKELEATLKHHQNIIEDHVQEIEYLTKQNAALREVNDSRMKIYEQLEVSIQDLERDKYKLALEYQAEKKHVKQLCSNIESLETKVEELTRSLEDARRQAEADRRTKQTERLLSQQQQQQPPGLAIIKLNSQTSHASKDAIPVVSPQGDDSTSRQKAETCQQNKTMSTAAAKNSGTVPSCQDGDDNQDDRDDGTCTEEHILSEDNEEVLRIMQELQRTQKCLLSEQGKVGELEEQLAAIAQENTALQSKLLNTRSSEIKSVHDELSMLAEFGQGQVCTRCLRDLGEQPDNDSIITGTEDDDASLMDLIHNVDIPKVYRSSVTMEILPTKPDSLDLSASECAGPTNPYRELVEKYEALLEVHRQPIVRKATTASAGATATTVGSGNNTPVDSCQPQQLLVDTVDGEPAPRYMIEFNPAIVACDPQERHAGEHQGIRAAAVAATECSETETASSGYSDEVSNKATQTDESPRNFLCTIADGKDWRFSIYEDESAIDSRFRFSPAHRELFREIFSVLRKAAENRDEGDQLPLLDDTKPIGGVVAGRGTTNPVPPVTPANEEPPAGFGIEEEEEDDDETVSFISSSAVSEQSFAMSECITKSERRRIARQAKAACRYGEEEPKPTELHLADDATKRQPQQLQHHPQHALPGAADGHALPAELDYISVTVGVHKRKSRRRSHRREGNQTVGLTPPTPPRTGSARKNRPSFRPWNPERDGATAVPGEWNGNSMTVYNRAIPKPGQPAPDGHGVGASTLPNVANTSHAMPPKSRRSGEKKRNSSGLRNRYADLMDDAQGEDVVEFRPSSASQHLHKLQKLDLSYAEVLRRADGGNPFPARRQYNKPQ
ncbi:uncharacterized protein LOC128307393 isoform X2 [Anopheles moucheti]|uniref:uncharacterized protein LOC128307393 isoform X2 n=1 Tax=Anopheles moucheti TaxID=186751 RepID=UPI0022F098B6|nr:uncharacterized protein LOC128307393 isoform X2 [Anopheles moucheti]XP_052901164.1 uncharacterized protein LOC128307393 isoform X2 [Anopheles moucheti]